MLSPNAPGADSLAYRKLLSSHHSIYNALTDPLLDCDTPESSDAVEKPATSAPLLAPQNTLPLDIHTPKPSLRNSGQFLPWQSIQLPASMDLRQIKVSSSPVPGAGSRPASASILSNSTDDDIPGESLVLVPSFKKPLSKVLVFETDEEDEGDEAPDKLLDSKSAIFADDESTVTSSTAQRRVQMRSKLLLSFVMPRLSVSDEARRITILGPSDDAWGQALTEFSDLVVKCVAQYQGQIQVVRLVANSPLAENVSRAWSSKLLFVINDGSLAISDFVSALANMGSDELPPKTTIVNILSSRYIVNLFSILSTLKPYQTLKTASLAEPKFLSKIEESLKTEFQVHDINPDDTKFSECRKKGFRKSDYKAIEKRIRNEMISSQNYEEVDPLNLNTNLGHMRLLFGSVRQFFTESRYKSDMKKILENDRFWLACSFTVGIGVGVTISAFHFFDLLKRSLFKDTHEKRELLVQLAPKKSVIDLALARVHDSVSEVFASVENFFGMSSPVADETKTGSFSGGFKALGVLAVDAAMGGYRKMVHMFF